MSFQHALSFRLALQNHRQLQQQQQHKKDNEYQSQVPNQPNELPYQQRQQGAQPDGQYNPYQHHQQQPNNNEFWVRHQQPHQQPQRWWDGQHVQYNHTVGGGGGYYQEEKHQPTRRQQYPQKRRGGRGSNQTNVMQRPLKQKKCDVECPTTQCAQPMQQQLENRGPDIGGPNCHKTQLDNADIHPPSPPGVNELEGGCSENATTQQQHMKGGFQDVNIEGQTFCVLHGMDPLHVQQWRRDRCKNWPSKMNLLRKTQELEQRERSGALVTNVEQQSKGPLQQKHRGKQHKRSRSQITEATTETSSSPKEDGEIIDASCASISQQKTLVVNEDEIEEVTSKKNEGPPPCARPKRPQLCKKFAKGMCKRGDACLFQHDSTKIRQRKKRNSIESTDMTTHPQGESSLLRVLLQKEVRQETNILLQCIRYLIKNCIPSGGVTAVASLQQ